MDRRRKENLLIIAAVAVVVIGFLFMFSKRWHSRLNGNDSLDVTRLHDATTVSSLIGRGTDVRQDFVCPYDTIKELVIIFSKTQRLSRSHCLTASCRFSLRRCLCSISAASIAPGSVSGPAV